MKSRLILTAALVAPLSACSQWLDPPQSIGDLNAGYRYIAIDPLPVSFTNDFSHCPAQTGTTPSLMNGLPDLASRVSTEDVTGEANASVPGVTVGGSGRSYRVTQDFIASDTVSLRFEVPPDLLAAGGMAPAASPLPASLAGVRALNATEAPRNPANRVITVPVYVGVGLRLTASLQIRNGKVNLTDLGAISGAVSANRVHGSLVAQTLGVAGPRMTNLVPLPGELNPTTIQAAAVAMGQMKVLLDDAATRPWPRVVGIHYPFARINPALVNAIVSALVARRIEWRPCATDEARLTLI